MMTAKFAKRFLFTLVIIILVFLALCMGKLYSYKRMTDPRLPKEKQLRSLFELKRSSFEKLHDMWSEDNFAPLRVGSTDKTSYGLPASRLHLYRDAMGEIQENLILIVNGDHVAQLVFENGESSLIVGPEWANGIEFIHGEVERRGFTVDSSSKVKLGEEQTYLIPLEQNWFIFHEQL